MNQWICDNHESPPNSADFSATMTRKRGVARSIYFSESDSDGDENLRTEGQYSQNSEYSQSEEPVNINLSSSKVIKEEYNHWNSQKSPFISRDSLPGPLQIKDLNSNPQDAIPDSHVRVGGHHRRNLSALTSHTTSSNDKKYSKRFSLQPHRVSNIGLENAGSHDGKDPKTPEEATGPNNDQPYFVGDEPGVNVDTMSVDLPDSQGSQVTLIDYSPEKCEISHYDIEKNGCSTISGSSNPWMVRRHLNDALTMKPDWSEVRWVVVNGLSMEAIQPIALHYKLHPLAVEDMLDIPQRIKMETFNEQTFCCFPLHILNTTPTPYTLVHKFCRVLVLWVARLFSVIIHLFHVVKKWSVAKQKRVDPEELVGSNNIFDKQHGRDEAKISNYSGTFHTTSFHESPPSTTESSVASKTALKWSTHEEVLNHSEPTICDQVTKMVGGDECIPFYTLNHGTLCGDADSSPVARKLKEIPARSIYEWNRGNLSLQREALQNMHIPGSTNSFEIALEQVSMFMVGNTVISFFEKNAPAIYRPLEDRLKTPSTLLRQSSDPIFLVQAVLDASVDLIGPILNEYRSRLNGLQTESVTRPSLQHTRALHAFITDLTVLKPHISSLYQLTEALWPKLQVNSSRGTSHYHGSRPHKDIKGSDQTNTRTQTRHHDQHHPERKPRYYEKCRVGPISASKCDYVTDDGTESPKAGDPGEEGAPEPPLKNFGFHTMARHRRAIAEMAGLYFGDVADHALHYLQDLDDMRNQSKTLSSLIFNTISIRAGDSVKLLSLVSVVFLPLTFLTGYFGMNFKEFSVLDHDVGYYWIVATPAAGALTVLLMYPSLMDQVQKIWWWGRAQV